MNRPRLILSDAQRERIARGEPARLRWNDNLSKSAMNRFSRQERADGYSGVVYRDGKLTNSYIQYLKSKNNMIIPIEGKIYNPISKKIVNDTFKNREKINNTLKAVAQLPILDYQSNVLSFFEMSGNEYEYENPEFVDKILDHLDIVAGQEVSAWIQISRDEKVNPNRPRTKMIWATDLTNLHGGDGLAIWFNKINPLLRGEYADGFFMKYLNAEGYFDRDEMRRDKMRIMVVRATEVPPEEVKQIFKKDINNLCVAKSVLKHFKDTINSAKTDKTVEKYTILKNKLKKYIKNAKRNEYYGIPESEMENFAIEFQVCIRLRDLFGNTVQTYNKKAKRSMVDITNVALNHVELGFVVRRNNPEYVSEAKMKELLDDCVNNKKPHLMNGKINLSPLSHGNSLRMPTKEIKTLVGKSDEFSNNKSLKRSRKITNNSYLNATWNNDTKRWENNGKSVTVNKPTNRKINKISKPVEIVEEIVNVPDIAKACAMCITPTKLCTQDKTYVLKTENKSIFDEMDKGNNIRSHELDAINYPEVNRFIRNGTTVHSTPVINKSEKSERGDITEHTRLFDIEKCYIQYHKCIYYQGFSNPQRARTFINPKTYRGIQATKVFFQKYNGTFRVRLLKFIKQEYLFAYDLKVNKIFMLQSPEIIMLMDEGCEFEVLDGAFGFIQNKYDILTTPDIREKKLYAHWFGKRGSQRDYDEYLITGDDKWAGHLRYQLGNGRVEYFHNLKVAQVKIPKKSVKTTHHILGFATSYARINIVQLMKSIVSQGGIINRVELDGVYFEDMTGNIQPRMPFNVHTDKPMKSASFYVDTWFRDHIQSYEFSAYNPKLDTSPYIFLQGQGGSGKTHSILTDKGIIQPLYVAPQNSLGANMREKYGVPYTTYSKLLGQGGGESKCETYLSETGCPYNLVADEVTQRDEETYSKIEELYTGACLMLAGDVRRIQYKDGTIKNIWYQTRNGNPHTGFSTVYIPDDYQYVNYTTDYRSLDDELKQFKLGVRKIMTDNFTDGGKADTYNVMREVYNTKLAEKCFIHESQAVKEFVKGEDIWIAGTNAKCQQLLEWGVISGYKTKDNRIVQQEEDNATPHGAFTIHSFQGITRETGKIYISEDFFEFGMLYTAISRARYFNQIRLVRGGMSVKNAEKPGTEVKKYEETVTKTDAYYRISYELTTTYDYKTQVINGRLVKERNISVVKSNKVILWERKATEREIEDYLWMISN